MRVEILRLDAEPLLSLFKDEQAALDFFYFLYKRVETGKVPIVVWRDQSFVANSLKTLSEEVVKAISDKIIEIESKSEQEEEENEDGAS